MCYRTDHSVGSMADHIEIVSVDVVGKMIVVVLVVELLLLMVGVVVVVVGKYCIRSYSVD